MIVTRQTVAEQIAAYLHHDISLADLVDWSESALLDGAFDEADCSVIAQVVSRLGVADVRTFGLTWEDCEDLLKRLGFVPRVEVVAA